MLKKLGGKSPEDLAKEFDELRKKQKEADDLKKKSGMDPQEMFKEMDKVKKL